MPQVFKLYRLQQFDSQIDQVKQQQKTIQEELDDFTQINNIKLELEEINQNLKDQQKKIKNVEEQGKAIQIKLEHNQASLYGGKINNPKELTDLQQESVSLRKQLQAVENDQLDLMIEAETTQQQFDSLQSILTQLEKDFGTRRVELTEEFNNFVHQLARLQNERSTIANITPEEDLRYYELIRSKRGGIAVAKITDQACSACGSTLSATLVHQAKSPNTLALCDTCGRILYSG